MKDVISIAICIVTYKRLNSLKRLLKSLEDAYYSHDVDLIISVDKSDSDNVKNFADFFKWKHGKKKVIAHDENLGLRKHVLKCGEFLDEYEALIVLEDDITVAPCFFYYVEQCVNKYSDNEKIAGISLYSFPLSYHNRKPFIPLHSDSDVYLQQTAQSWGQVWMRKSWREFKKWYDEDSSEFSELPHLPSSICSWPKSSWLKYHSKYCIEKNKYFVYPYTSLSTNNGEAGTHVNHSDFSFQSPMLYGIKTNFNLNPTVVYDGFFENELLYECLRLNKRELCIDLYGTKGNREMKKYWLTCKQESYKVIKSYELALRPIEMNIISNRLGNDIFLYDTSVVTKNKFSNNRNMVFSYFYSVKVSISSVLRMFFCLFDR